MKTLRFPIRFLLSVIGVTAFGALSAQAQVNMFWRSMGGGSFESAANWSEFAGQTQPATSNFEALPDSAHRAVFTLIPNGTVTFAGNATTAEAQVLQGTAAFSLGGFTWNTGTSFSVLAPFESDLQSLVVTVTVSGGTLTTGTLLVGAGDNTNLGTLTLNAATLSSANFSVAQNGTGILNLTNGSALFTTPTTVSALGIGGQAGSTGLVSVSGGSTWTIGPNGMLHVGSFGASVSGALTITSGTVSGTGMNVGGVSGAGGVVTVAGSSSQLTMSNGISIGSGGVGALSLSGGGKVNSAPGSISSVGGSSGGVGSVSVDGAGSRWTVGDLYVGSSGASGIVNLTNGGLLSATGTVFVNGGGTLVGTGQVNGAVVLNGGLLAPGSSSGGAGTLTFGNSLTLSSGTLRWQLSSAAGGAAADYLSILGSLAVNPTGSPSLTLSLVSLTSGGAGGLVGDFSSATTYSWPILGAAGGITGFNASSFAINTTAFANSLDSGSFSIVQVGNSLNLRFTPFSVPVPGTYSWSGASVSGGNWDDAANWAGGTVPSTSGLDDVFIGPAPQTGISAFNALNLNSLHLSGAFDYFNLMGGGSGTLTLQGGGLSYAPTEADIQSQIFLPVTLAADQTWNIASGELEVYGNLNGSGNLTKTGAGELGLYGFSTIPDALVAPGGSGGTAAVSTAYTGNITLLEGGLTLGNSNALGEGTLTIGPANLTTPSLSPYLSMDSGGEIYNDIVVNGLLALGSESDTLNLFGLLTLAADTTLNPSDSPIYLMGGVAQTGGARKLTVDGFNAAVLIGNSTYSGGTAVNRGLLAFAQPGALPATGTLSAALNSYLGVAFTANTQTAFLDRFDKANTQGTIGLDTDPEAMTANVFSGNLDLTGFGANARLGSGTEAKLTGTITPQGADYQFGGGGGFLEVASALTGARGVKVFTPDFPTPTSLEQFFSAASLNSAPLIVLLTSTGNSFTGNVSVTNSALAFGPGALPVGPVLKAGQGGYLSTADPSVYTPASTLSSTTAINSFVARFDPVMKNGIIGFDDATGSYANVGGFGDTLDLTVFTSTTDPGIYLGSASDIGLWPAITLPGSASAYRFAGFQGGVINVFSTLTGTYSVIVGDPLNIATVGNFGGIGGEDFLDEVSVVQLSGINTYTGGTTLYAGLLIANGGTTGNPTPVLGGGALTVQPNILTALTDGEDELEAFAALAVGNDGVIIPNSIVLNANLALGNEDADASFQLSGIVSGPGGLIKEGGGTVTLSAANTFAGGIHVGAGTLVFAHNSAAGTGPFTLADFSDDNGGGGGTGGTALFITSSPVVFNLSSGHNHGGGSSNSAALISLALNTVLTINQSTDGAYNGAIVGAGGLVKQGAGTLKLSGANTHTGGTTISGGTLALNGGGTLGGPAGSVTLASGATLDLTHSAGGLSVGTFSGSGTVVLGAQQLTASAVMLGDGGVITGTTGSLSVAGSFLATETTAASLSAAVAGATGLSHTGSGTLRVTMSQLYTGLTDIVAGKVQLANVSLQSPVSAHGSGTLAGTGTVAGTLTVSAGGAVAPGDGTTPGTLTVGSAMFAPGGTLTLLVSPLLNTSNTGGSTAGGVAGTDWSRLRAGTLDLASLTTGSFTLRLVSTGGGFADPVLGMSGAGNVRWASVITAGSVVGSFAPGGLVFDAGAFLGGSNSGTFSLEQTGAGFDLIYITAVPEPAAWAALAGAAVLLLAGTRKQGRMRSRQGARP